VVVVEASTRLVVVTAFWVGFPDGRRTDR